MQQIEARLSACLTDIQKSVAESKKDLSVCWVSYGMKLAIGVALSGSSRKSLARICIYHRFDIGITYLKLNIAK